MTIPCEPAGDDVAFVREMADYRCANQRAPNSDVKPLTTLFGVMDMKNIIRNYLNAIGFDIVRVKNQHGDLSEHLSNVFTAKNIDCIIDVGANSGQFALFVRELGFEGYIVSFEPVKSAYNTLEMTAKSDDKWLCYNLALGDREEKKTINVYKGTTFSSFFEANEYSKNIWQSLGSVEPEIVNVVKLDDIFGEILRRTGCANFYLKMDTQGYDINVFHGAVESLEKIKSIQSELSLIAIYNDMPPAYDILNEFHQYGFFISGMYPVNRDESLAVIEYDCVLVKRSA